MSIRSERGPKETTPQLKVYEGKGGNAMREVKKAALYGLMPCMVVGSLLALCSAARAQQLAGRGEWESLSGDAIRGTWSVALQRSDTHVNGTMALTGSNVLKTASVSGTIEGQNIVLGLSSDGISEATFSGQLSGTSISGEWDCPTIEDQGVWQGTLAAGE